MSKLYLQYVKIFRKLELCYDQIVHPQKCLLIRQLLDSTVGRILELKHELINLDNLEYSYHDETMIETMTEPSEVELVIPKFVLRSRHKEIEYWDDQMQQALAKMLHSELDVSIKCLLSIVISCTVEICNVFHYSEQQKRY